MIPKGSPRLLTRFAPHIEYAARVNYASRDPLLGRTLDDRYRVRSRIARGGMGMVYLADDLRLGRKVAIKVMHPHLVDDATFVRRFEKEAHAAARLNDQNVVNVFDQGFDGDAPYLVMEYVPGITLRQLLKQQKRLTADQAIEISEAVLSGLSAAHQAGFIHRDVKPENVFLADDGRIKIGDFGLARPTDSNTTTGQALLGTIAYLSPELITRGVADARSDIYAFGIMLYEMLTGTQPYRGEQAMQIAYQHAHEDVPKPSLASSESTPELDEIVRWTTARDPEQRPKDATVALVRMRQLLGTGLNAATRALPDEPNPDEHSTTVLPETEAERIARVQASPPKPPSLPESPLARLQTLSARRNKRGWIITAVIVVLAVLAGGVGWWFGQGPGAPVAVPDVVSMTVPESEAVLTAAGFAVTVSECHSLKVPAGLVESTTPQAGARIPAGSTVDVCESLGPQLLPVPQLTGLPQAEAEAAITASGFRFGEVSDTRFVAADSAATEPGSVIAAVDQDGEGLPETFPEQGVIDLIVSAGVLPDVADLTAADAEAALIAAGLEVAGHEEAFHDSVAAGNAVSFQAPNEVVRPGDSVTLIVSQGPEPVEIPDVRQLTMTEAVNTLKEAGLSPKTSVPELFWNAVKVKETTPAPGESVPPGTEVELQFEL